MKLVTFQSMEALKSLINNKELVCNPSYIDESYLDKYNWIVTKMNEKVKNPGNIKYPLWCWVKCYNGICPPKHKGKKVDGFDVKITFKKDIKDVFITDYRMYSFLLNNIYIPSSIKDKNEFDKKLEKLNLNIKDLKTAKLDDSLSNMIKSSFDKCISVDGDILQGCVWNIKLEDVLDIEILNDDGYKYGSLNYIRSNGKRIDWQKEYYKLLK